MLQNNVVTNLVHVTDWRAWRALCDFLDYDCLIALNDEGPLYGFRAEAFDEIYSNYVDCAYADTYEEWNVRDAFSALVAPGESLVITKAGDDATTPD